MCCGIFKYLVKGVSNHNRPYQNETRFHTKVHVVSIQHHFYKSSLNPEIRWFLSPLISMLTEQNGDATLEIRNRENKMVSSYRKLCLLWEPKYEET
jgi:hypothetical protein